MGRPLSALEYYLMTSVSPSLGGGEEKNREGFFRVEEGGRRAVQVQEGAG